MNLEVTKNNIKDYPIELRPRERLAALGIESLGDRDLIAILLSTGTKALNALQIADVLLAQVNGLKGLVDLSLEELATYPGIGIGKGARIAASIELGKRISLQSMELRPTISSPRDVSNLLMNQVRFLDKEHFMALLLNTKKQLISHETISIGTLNSTMVHPREVFKIAIKRSAQSMILVHNHPSGDIDPSVEDRKITQRLTEVGELLGIPVLDHIIIGDNKYYSFKEHS